MMIVIRVGFLLRFVNDSIFMFRRATETVQLKRCRSPAIDDIVPGPGRDDDRKAVAHRVFLSVQDHGSLPFLESDKLVHAVNFFSDFFTGLEVH